MLVRIYFLEKVMLVIIPESFFFSFFFQLLTFAFPFPNLLVMNNEEQRFMSNCRPQFWLVVTDIRYEIQTPFVHLCTSNLGYCLKLIICATRKI